MGSSRDREEERADKETLWNQRHPGVPFPGAREVNDQGDWAGAWDDRAHGLNENAPPPAGYTTYYGDTTMGSSNEESSNVASNAANDYTALINAMIAAQPKLLAAQQQYGPANIAQRLEQLRLSVGGSADTPGPALYMEALRKADPQGMAGLDTLSQSATEELKLGRNLNANQQRQVEQSVRGGQAARGMGYGPTDIYQEMLQKLGYGDQLLNQRQQQAMNVSQVRTALGSRGVDAALGMGTGVGPALISNDFAGNLLGSTYAGANQQSIAELNRRSNNFGGFGSGGGYGGGGGSSAWVNYDTWQTQPTDNEGWTAWNPGNTDGSLGSYYYGG